MRAIKRIVKFGLFLSVIVCAVSCTSSVLSGCGCEDGYVKQVTVAPADIFNTDTESVSFGPDEAASDGVYVEFMSKVDGDTAWFHVPDGDDIKVRFLGIDTPETVKEGVEVQEWGPEASEYTTDRLSNAHEIYLEFDPNSDITDAYGRTLAWVWVDGSLIEKELVEQGYAEVAYIYGDYLYTDVLYEAQEAAQNAGLGIWS